MMIPSEVCGSIPNIILDKKEVYEGNLIHYAQVMFRKAQNLSGPYHNFRHMFHVLWLCYEACCFYARSDSISPRDRRNLLIAALFHDSDHSRMPGHDDLNIARAIRRLRENILTEDTPHIEAIIVLIQYTEYPHATDAPSEDLCANILRDADMMQVLSPAWIQQVIFGLAAEWKIEPIEALRMQEGFLRGLQFNSQWARELCPQSMIDDKIDEAKRLLEILD